MKNPFQKIWDKFPSFLKNKYAVTILVYIAYLMFFDSNDIPSQIKFNAHLNKLNKQIEYCEKMIVKDREEYAATLSSIDQMETYAREHYMMKKPEEDLFIIEVK